MINARPIYEQRQDRINEADAVAAVGLWLDCDEVVALERLSQIDYEIRLNGRVKYMAEVKCRNNLHDKYPDLMLSKAKYDNLLASQAKTSIPSLLIARWTDRIGYLRLPVPNLVTGTGGRIDRGDPRDIERVVHIPVSCFTLMER